MSPGHTCCERKKLSGVRPAAAARGAGCRGRAAKEGLSGQRGGSSPTKSSPSSTGMGLGAPMLCLLWPQLLLTSAAWLAAPQASQGHGAGLWCKGMMMMMMMMKRRKVLNDSNCLQPLKGFVLQRGSILGQGEGREGDGGL